MVKFGGISICHNWRGRWKLVFLRNLEKTDTTQSMISKITFSKNLSKFGRTRSSPNTTFVVVWYGINYMYQIGLPLSAGPSLLITCMIPDRILHSVLLPLQIAEKGLSKCVNDCRFVTTNFISTKMKIHLWSMNVKGWYCLYFDDFEC